MERMRINIIYLFGFALVVGPGVCCMQRNGIERERRIVLPFFFAVPQAAFSTYVVNRPRELQRDEERTPNQMSRV